MSNQFYTSEKGVNWENVANLGIQAGVSGLMTGGIGALTTAGTGLLKGVTSQYFNKKSEKRAYQRMLQQMEAEYQYAQRYAENSPSWTVKGLRDAGINPMLAFGSPPVSPSVGSHSISPTQTDVKGDNHWDPMALSQLAVNSAQVRNLDNQGQAALINAKANQLKAASDIRKSDAETALRVLEKERYDKGANYDNPHLRDSHQVLNHALDFFGSSWDYLSDNLTPKGTSFDSFVNYVKHGPRSTHVDKKVYNKLESLLDSLSEALPFRGFRHKLKGTSQRVRSLIYSR